MKTILIQGAMDCEIDELIEFYKPKQTKTIGGFKFWICENQDSKIIISKTDVGIINATTATTIAVLKFKPDIVINQGCAGSAIKDINPGKIIVGESAIYINHFNTPLTEKGGKSDSLKWPPNTKRSYKIQSSEHLVELAKQLENSETFHFGILGSGDIYNREYDRICHLQNLFGHMCEDMESIAVFKVCENFGVDRIGFRVISNNELNKTDLDKSTTKISQKLAIDFVDLFLKQTNEI